MERIEGVYTYRCNKCESVFGIVARFGVIADRTERVQCPKCKSVADIYGEGHMKHIVYEKYEYETKKDDLTDQEVIDSSSKYPMILNVNHISEILGVSKRWAYEMMEWTEFPTIKIRRRKLVNKDDFFEWLATHESFERKK